MRMGNLYGIWGAWFAKIARSLHVIRSETRPPACGAIRLAFLVVAANAIAWPATGQDASGAPTGPRPTVAVALPLYFVPNTGWAGDEYRFVSPNGRYAIGLSQDGTTMSLAPSGGTGAGDAEHTLRIRFAGSNSRARIEGIEPGGKVNLFVGDDPSRWGQQLTAFAKVRYRALYPGVDLVFYGNGRELEFDFRVAAGVDTSAIGFDLEGVDEIAVDAAGDLVLRLGREKVRLKKAVGYQGDGTARRMVATSYRVAGKRVAFDVAGYDRSRPLVIDPVLAYATYFGGIWTDVGYGSAVDQAGNAYISGSTQNLTAPYTSVYTANSVGGTDAFLAKLNSNGQLVYSAIFGGKYTDRARYVALDANGSAYVAGSTNSPNFPVSGGPYQRRLAGGSDGFIARFDPLGRLTYASYLGGWDNDELWGLSVDSLSDVYVVGVTYSTDAPLGSAGFQPVAPPGGNCLVAKFTAGGSQLAYGSYLGGSDFDDCGYVVVDETGSAYISGYTYSMDFPRTDGPLQWNGSRDAYVVKLSPAGNVLEQSIVFGGSGEDTATSIALDAAGNLFATGYTTSPDLPVTIGPGWSGGTYWGTDTFVMKRGPAIGSISYLGYLGGSDDDMAGDIAVDTEGNAYIAGGTGSLDFPVIGAVQPVNAGGWDMFISVLGPDGVLRMSTYLGGSSNDEALRIALDGDRTIYAVGDTDSSDFLGVNSGVSYQGRVDAIVVKLQTCQTHVDDGDPCTADVCDPGTGVVTHISLADDRNPCTVDSCDPVAGVSHVPVTSGTSCSDGDRCNGDEVCDGNGVCLAGTPPSISDGYACTADSCDPISGVSHEPLPAGAACSDGNACNGEEACDGTGVCMPGVAVVLDDGNPCTADACHPVTGVSHIPVQAETPCSDGNYCNGFETCDGLGTCLAGLPPTVDDGAPCTADSCDPVTGVWNVPVPAGTSCADATVCNGAEVCSGTGACTAGTALIVDDGDPCTSDACDPVAGVAHTLIAGCSVIPPDPRALAAPAIVTTETSLFDATEFLFSGATPIQTGVAAGSLDPRRLAVLRGRILASDATPLSSVRVTAQGHPEFGRTWSRADGAFDLAVNGGGVVMLDFTKEGYLPAQRRVETRWQDYAAVPDVILVAVDPRVTTIQANAPGAQVVTGSVVSDSAGTRTARVVFPAGTQAGMTLSDGSSQILTTLNVRITEYTAGMGPKAMPGELPPASGYTYALEVGVDEAVAAGATDVRFSQPVSFYVDNFLGFPVGGTVPLGYYDRASAIWRPSEDGRVIKVLAENGGRAVLDVDGSGSEATATALATLGITDVERETLAALYDAGQELWRVRMTHFSPYDCNWPLRCAAATGTSCAPPPPTPKPKKRSCEESGSIIECEAQGLRESIPIVGTPFSLAYSTQRAPGYAASRVAIVALTGSTVPSPLQEIGVELSIAGQRVTRTFGPPFVPNDHFEFQWDGRDGYGRTVVGTAILSVTVEYRLNSNFLSPTGIGPAFGALSPTGTPVAAGRLLTQAISYSVPLGNLDDAIAERLGGWTLDVHHRYESLSGILYKGDGTASPGPSVIRTLTGGGTDLAEGIPAERAYIGEPSAVAAASDGTVYVATWESPPDGIPRVRKIDPSGTITSVTATSRDTCLVGAAGNGQPASSVCISPSALAYDRASGDLYIADFQYYLLVWRLGTDGVLHLFAGQDAIGPLGDAGPAVQATLGQYYIWGLAVGPDGAVYIIGDDNRVRRVDASGIITTIAGNGTGTNSGDGGPAALATIRTSWGALAIGPDGSVYVSDGESVVRRIASDGFIDRFAGTEARGYSGDGGSALAAQLDWPQGLAVDSDGTVYIADPANHRIRRVGPDGIITTVAGNGTTWTGNLGDSGPATAASVYYPWQLALGPNGTLYVAEDGRFRIRALELIHPKGQQSQYLIPSTSAGEVYIFDSRGRHLRTADARTGVTLYAFGYGTTGLLEAVTDRDGNATRIERSADGKPIAIVAPYGQRTLLNLDLNGHLAAITNPAGEATVFTYYNGRLLQTLTDPRGYVHSFGFDPVGRLISDANPAGGLKTLSRVDGERDYTVTVTKAIDRSNSVNTSYYVQSLTTGDTESVVTFPDGTSSVAQTSASGSTTITDADGTMRSVTVAPDPRFGMEASFAASTTTTTPGGIVSRVAESRGATLADPMNPLSATWLTETVAVNGRATLSTYDVAARTQTSQSPAGRTTVALLDAQGRVVEVRPPGYSTGAVWPVQLTYDANGRLYSASQGSRTITIGYDAQGYPASFTDPLQRTIHAWYDAAGRVIDQELLGTRHVTFGYDRNGNLTSLTPPGRPAHAFAYTSMDQTASFTPPLASGTGLLSTAYAYYLDGSVEQMLLPDESIVTQGHDAAGRLASVTTARGTTTIGYDAAGRVGSLTAPDGGQVSFGYDGFLKTSETWTGAVAGSVGYIYDSGFRVSAISVGGSSASYEYDPDGLLTQAGALTIGRDAGSGWLTGTTAGQVTTSQVFSQYGELSSFFTKVNGSVVFSYTLDRDAVGRIFHKTETIGGTTIAYSYEYDAAGRLWTVSRNGAAVSIYTYDANGNRLTGPLSQTGTYDDQDRMLAYGAATYTYGPNGDLRTKTESGQTTSFAYDALGNLIAAALPDGTLVEYLIDGKNRRIGKKVNGQLVEGFLYEGHLRPVVWLNGAGQVLARFVYGTRVNVPEYMVTAVGTFRLVSDYLGSPRLVIDTASGAIAQRIDYDEWGNVLQDTAPGFQPFGFAGGLWDRTTGLVRFGARDYDPNVGRWTSRDPIGFDGGWNVYSYVRNDPLNLADPEGLEAATITAGGGIALGGGAAAAVAAGVVGAGVLICLAVEDCRKEVSCAAKLVWDIVKCAGPEATAKQCPEDPNRCLRIALEQYRFCRKTGGTMTVIEGGAR